MERAPHAQRLQPLRGARHLLVRKITLTGGIETAVLVDALVLYSYEFRCKHSFADRVISVGNSSNMQDKWKIGKDSRGHWRWQRVATNGRIVGASTEGYVNRIDCEANARRNGWPGLWS